ncbi:MAG: multicopper oxidase domain-containing protein [Proteobacteria bacterium]|nr:multicopper oxidase domain-containing protein [Pseudomonadota bacterium]
MSSVPSRLVRLLPALALLLLALDAQAQSFRVQCPAGTALHPANTGGDAAYDTITRPLDTSAATNPTGTLNINHKLNPLPSMANPHIKCQQLSGGDGFATMGDGTQTYLFAFGPLSGLSNIVNGQPGTTAAADFLKNNLDSANGPVGADGVLDAVKIGAPDGAAYAFNGAIGLVPDVQAVDNQDPTTGNNLATPGTELTGHVDPRLVMDVGVLNGNAPAPMIAIDEGDELFLTLTNVGMVMRPDLFEQHTVHFHGYPNASSFYDGVPDASVAINIGGSFTYYYLAPEAGTYMWHCHISPPEHLQMGMVGQLYVRPRQNGSGDVYTAAKNANDPASPDYLVTKCSSTDLLCSTQVPPSAPVSPIQGAKYAFNDGDGSTEYDVEYPVQLMGFDPNFHFVGMTFNPESFADNKDKYFLMNGRSYPDTINPEPMKTQSSDGVERHSQPLPTIINIPCLNQASGVCGDGRALLRISDLNVTEYHTLASLGVRMHVVGYNARLLRDVDGNNTDYYTNSIHIAGGESVDVILEAKGASPRQKFYLYAAELDHLSNDAENFGGMMTEVNICPSDVNPTTKACN